MREITNREISYKELKDIAGGNFGTKMASGILSMLALMPSAGSFSVKGIEVADTASGLFVSAKNKTQNAVSYVAQAVKSGFIKTADWIKNNPRKAALIAGSIAGAIIAGGLVYKYQKSKIVEEKQKAEAEQNRAQEETRTARKNTQKKRNVKTN